VIFLYNTLYTTSICASGNDLRVKPKKTELNGIKAGQAKQDIKHWLGALPYPLILISENNQILLATGAFKTLTGYTPAELKGALPPYPFWPPEAREKYRGLINKNRPFSGTLRDKKGQVVAVRVTVKKVVAGNGESWHLLGFEKTAGQSRLRNKTLKTTGQVEQKREAIPGPSSISPAEPDLKNSDERFRRISEAAEDLIYSLQLYPQLRIDYISPAYERILGYKAEQGIPSTDQLLSISHPDDRPVLRRILTDPLSLASNPVVLRWRHRDGHWVQMEHRHSFMSDRTGQAIGLVGIGRDITQRILMEENLRAGQEFANGLLEASLNPVIVMNRDTSIRYVNQAFVDLTGYSREEVLKSYPPRPWWPVEKIEEYAKLVNDNYMGLQNKQEWVYKKKNGEYFWVLTSVTRAMKDGQVDYLLSNWVDITQRQAAEDALRASEAYNSALLNNIPIPVLVINKDSSIRYVNPAMERLTGFSRDEIIGQKRPYPWWPAGLVTQYLEVSERNRALRSTAHERVFQTRSGQTIYVMANTVTISKGGQDDYMLSSWVDITGRKKAEFALTESEKYAQALISNAPNPITVSDAQGTLKYVNQAMVEHSGFSVSELIGQTYPYPWWPPELRQTFIDEDKQQWGQTVGLRERRYLKKNGDVLWVALSRNIVRDEKGQVIYIITNWVDITGLKLAQQLLQQSEEKTRLILSSIADGLLITDLQGNVVDCNESTLRMGKITRHQLIGQNVTLFLAPEEREQALNEIKRLVATGVSEYFEYQLVRPDGSTFPVNSISNLVRDKDGQPLFLVVSFQDISESKQLEKRIYELYETEKKQNEELQAEARARGMFIDILAHELRTPLTPILASTGMLKDLLQAPPDSLVIKLCNNINNSADVLAHRLEELLDVARYARGVFRLNRTPVELKAFFYEVLARFKPSLDQRNQALITSVAENLPVAMVDASRLEQVVINLVSNASKFSPEKSSIYFIASYSNNELKIEVRDEGIGISEEEQSRLFQPYHRVEQDRLKFPGIGLGLAVSKQIVEAHGGKISVHSQLGQGSIFTINLPLEVYQL
jgi:PAS domain S-box-containing protein